MKMIRTVCVILQSKLIFLEKFMSSNRIQVMSWRQTYSKTT